MAKTAAKVFVLALLSIPAGLLPEDAGRAQKANITAVANQARARQVLAATIQALGGDAWLNVRTVREQGKTAAYFQGTPTGVVAETTDTRELPDELRIDFAGKGRVVQIYSAQQGWEITYKGAKPVPAEKLQEYLRWRGRSLRVALQQWFPDPATVLIDEGQALAERHLADKITLLSPRNDAITLEIDAATHLPIRLSFAWRDARFHDKNVDAVEYDNYQVVDGMATPFTITRTRNGQRISQRFILLVKYNVAIPTGFFDPALEAKRKR